LAFEANRGQSDAQVSFLSRGSGRTLFLTRNEAVLVLDRREHPAQGSVPAARLRADESAQVRRTVVRTTFVGANAKLRLTGSEPLPGRAHYFIGNDPTKWQTNVPMYAKVQYDDLYAGIDLVYYGTRARHAPRHCTRY
jgi:hypothetical protein